MTELSICKHGQLQRQCEICELIAANAELMESAKHEREGYQTAIASRPAAHMWREHAENAEAELAEVKRAHADAIENWKAAEGKLAKAVEDWDLLFRHNQETVAENTRLSVMIDVLRLAAAKEPADIFSGIRQLVYNDIDWLENAEHGSDQARFKRIAGLLRTAAGETKAQSEEPAQAQVGRDVLTGAGSKHCEAPVPAAGPHDEDLRLASYRAGYKAGAQAVSAQTALPCPFCGQLPEIAHDSYGVRVRCISISCLRPSTLWGSWDEDRAVKEWNMRTAI